MAENEKKVAKGLPKEAYIVMDGEKYPPVVPPETELREFTLRAVLIGALVGVVFGAANAYLGLKVGLTVSASIPAAVIGVATFGLLRKMQIGTPGSILETNMVQTVGSAGESLAAGVIFTLPVFFLWGMNPGFWPIFPLALLGGLLGVLFMIPLRRFLIVREHGVLTYPEGTACAEVLVASESGGKQAKLLFGGMFVGMFYALLSSITKLWPGEASVPVNKGGYRTEFGGELTPELLGVGFILGPRIAAVMLAGGAVGWLVIIPLIYSFGGTSVVKPGVIPVAEMGAFDVWSRYLRYIGAGAVAFGGIFTLIKSLPTIVNSFILGVSQLGKDKQEQEIRTQRDTPFKYALLAILVIGAGIVFLPLAKKADGFHALGWAAAVAIVVFSFFFVTVSSRIVGLLGSSSNPISGMTIATVLICALIFGAAGEESRIVVLTIGALVCISAAIAGDTSQDLKTGHLVGATPYRQQYGEVVGVITAALAMSFVLTLFSEKVVSGDFKAPQANLIKLVIEGVLGGDLPWGLVMAGVFMAFCVEIMGLPTLAFAVGLYLPVHLAVPIMVGGLIRLFLEWRYSQSKYDPEELDERREEGVLYSSGLIAGAALIGVFGAALAFFEMEPFKEAAWYHKNLGLYLAVGAFCLLAVSIFGLVNRKRSHT